MNIYELFLLCALFFFAFISLKEMIKDFLCWRKQKKYRLAYRHYNYFMAIGLIESADIIKIQAGITLPWK